MVGQVPRLGLLVVQQDQVLRQWPALAQPDPRLRDVRIGVEAPHLHAAVVVLDRVPLDHQVLLDRTDLGRRVARPAVQPRGRAEVADDVGHVAVIGAEAVVRLVGPVEGADLVAGPDRAPGRDILRGVDRLGGSQRRVRVVRAGIVGQAVRLYAANAPLSGNLVLPSRNRGIFTSTAA